MYLLEILSNPGPMTLGHPTLGHLTHRHSHPMNHSHLWNPLDPTADCSYSLFLGAI